MKENQDKQKQKQKQKQEEITTAQKIVSKIYYFFCGEDKLDPIINRSIISNTYLQIIQIIHFTFLFTIFSSTNNETYTLIQTTLSAFIIFICIIPRMMHRYTNLLFILIVFTVIFLASASVISILIINYYTFQEYCNILSAYSIKNTSFIFTASSTCTTVINLYKLQLVFGGFIEILRGIYIYLIVKAYKVAWKKFNDQQKKRRRQQKFDENMKSKEIFNPTRRI